jgi:hypothetical protein
MQRIVINTTYGGFHLSERAREIYRKITGVEISDFGNFSDESGRDYVRRDDPALVTTVEKLGRMASHEPGDLKIVEIPDDVKWVIREYDGAEWIAEEHRTWR